MKWAYLQRASAALLVVLIIASAHVATPSVTASKALTLALLLAATVHTTGSLRVVLTEQRRLADHTRAVTAALLVLGAGAAIYGASVILRAPDSKPPVLGHLPGSECQQCHTRDEHVRWPLALHAPRGGAPGVGCEGCHGVTSTSPKLLAYRDAETGEHVAATAIEVCLECHGPKLSEKPMWPGAIHGGVKCGTCHSRVGTADAPSWKRACQKCHPRADDPHIDVRSLDTTYLSLASKNDVHRMKCAACHTEGADR